MALVRGRREEGDDEARLQNNERATGVGDGQCNNTDTTAYTLLQHSDSLKLKKRNDTIHPQSQTIDKRNK